MNPRVDADVEPDLVLGQTALEEMVLDDADQAAVARLQPGLLTPFATRATDHIFAGPQRSAGKEPEVLAGDLVDEQLPIAYAQQPHAHAEFVLPDREADVGHYWSATGCRAAIFAV